MTQHTVASFFTPEDRAQMKSNHEMLLDIRDKAIAVVCDAHANAMRDLVDSLNSYTRNKNIRHVDNAPYNLAEADTLLSKFTLKGE